jgi:hypothetical protein
MSAMMGLEIGYTGHIPLILENLEMQQDRWKCF